jgi:hypothetical protein
VNSSAAYIRKRRKEDKISWQISRRKGTIAGAGVSHNTSRLSRNYNAYGEMRKNFQRPIKNSRYIFQI